MKPGAHRQLLLVLAGQIALALTVPTSSFVADSTAVRIFVLGPGAMVTVRHVRHLKTRPVAP